MPSCRRAAAVAWLRVPPSLANDYAWLAGMYRLHQRDTFSEQWRWAAGTRRGSARYSLSKRTSIRAGAPGRPISRESCATVISVGEGIAASTSEEDMDAMFQPRPHGAIAVDPLTQVHISARGNVNS